uniref:U-box domain containing 5 n=1 Tax=Iconisemion striatum TaxID=60296 RepID=A0A1A7WZ25_9TELE
MVVNLCQPHFHTTAHCNKLCADGYDVSNLVSADPALRKQGFKLEYFVRPPLQVTLKFGFPVDLCRVDVELWPWGMDRGQACKRLEISTSSDPLLPPGSRQDEDEKSKQGQSRSQQSNGHRWNHQARHWDEDETQQRHCVFRNQSNTESNNFESEFKLVARCELREEIKVSFRHSNFRPRAPFLSPPPPQQENCREEQLWSRGLSSLSSVTQLRVTVPFGGSASSLGLKALALWGQPARGCPTEEVERIKRIHEAAERRVMQPAVFAPSFRRTTQTLQTPLRVSIPEEFLDPITQEVMVLPMLLPSGVSVDNTTLEEYQKREASWGRLPNDPFTGVSFSPSSQPLPNPLLKSRIDRFLLQKGMVGKDGMLGGKDQGQNPQTSRLITSNIQEQSQNRNCVQSDAGNRTSEQKSHPDDSRHVFNTKHLSTDNKSDLDKQNKRCLSEIYKESTEVAETESKNTKKSKHSDSGPSCSSHEQLLSASLDKALTSALQGRPSFTSNLPQQQAATSGFTEPCQSSGCKSTSAGEKSCAGCSCSLSAYSASSSPIYRLICGHLLCRACLQRETKQQNSSAASCHVLCSTCRSLTPRCDITRVHH